jgi:UDP:flavonoid glycosyltransferase YjiC (YdhE family)
VAPDPPAGEHDDIWARVASGTRDEASVLVNRDLFADLYVRTLFPALDAACEKLQPDLLLHEAAELAAPVVGHRRGLPHAQVAIGLARVEEASLRIGAPALARYGDDVVRAVLGSPYLTHLPEQLDPSPYPTTLRYLPVPSRQATGQAAAQPFPSGVAPTVLVSLGTVVGSTPLGQLALRCVVEAVAGLAVRALVTLGRRGAEAPDDLPLPSHVRVVDWLDQGAATAAADLVVCHGGAGTTFGSLLAGRPLVVVPVMADQPANGRVVDSAGAGIVVAPDADDAAGTTERVRAAIQRVLTQPDFTAAAQRVSAQMALMPALDEVLDLMPHLPR